jgi:hypothetical protein
MNTHTMRFTALPNGVTEQVIEIDPEDNEGGIGGGIIAEDGPIGILTTVPQVSAHLAFRLSPTGGTGVLDDFPAALDWPAQSLDWTITFRRGTTVQRYAATAVTEAVPEWWSAIFRPDLAVRNYVAPTNRSSRRIRTFRATRLASRWRDAYVSVAQSIDDAGNHLPVGADPTTGLLAAFESAGLWDERRAKTFADESLRDELETTLAGFGFVPDAPPVGMPAAQVARRDVLEFQRFLTRFRLPDPADTGPEPGDRLNRISWVRPPELDFHQLTTALAAHAALLRNVGLVVDVVPQAEWDQIYIDLGRGWPDSVSVTAAPADGTSFVVDPSPWTRCLADASRFSIAPQAGGDITPNGFLKLGDPTRFSTEVLDVEATTLKAIGLGATVQLRDARRSRSTPDRETTPTMRASGIAVTRINRAQTFHEAAFQRGDLVADKMNSNPDELVLDTDDVLRGYRLDVQPEGSGNWRSVVVREGTLAVEGGDPIPLEAAEGWVSPVPVADDAGDLYLGEEQLRWDGFSPVAPKPGRLIDPEDQVADDRRDPLPGIPVVARYRPTPGTLVPLRYGRRYRLRARVVDIAGNGPEPDAPSTPDEETAPILFGRLDPVGSPDLVATAPRLPGEELGRVVVRSRTRDLAAEGVNGRHILPPRTTVVEAERHGVLDDGAGRPDPSRYSDLAQRDGYGLHTDPASQVDPNAPDDTDEGAARYVPIGDPLGIGFLPDPLARFVQLRRPDGTSILPGDLATTGIPLMTDRSWPADARSIRIVVEEGAFFVDWDDTNAKLVVRLPKATTLPLRMSSVFAADDLVRFGLAEWVAREVVPGEEWPRSVETLRTTPLGQRIVAGRNWTFTPWQALTLVHAVKDPLRDPEINPPVAFTVIARQLAETSSQVTVPARWHGTSTGRLDLLASWTEGIDDGPGTEPPRRELVQVLATELDRTGVPGPDGVIESSIRTRHEHDDTKYRSIDYQLEASGAFLDHFTETRSIAFEGTDEIELTGIDPAGIALGTVRLTGAVSKDPGAAVVTFRRDDGSTGAADEPIAFQLASTPGGSTAKLIRLNPVIPNEVPLTLRFVTNPISHRSNIERRVVRASARPAAPIVHSVLPTFDWERSSSGSTATSTRRVAGVRVWLERPWWSSGLGEQLAVLYLGGSGQPVETQIPFVTQWGRDPIHAAGNVISSMTDAAFPLRLRGSEALRPPNGPIVRAVPHRVHFDRTRDLWYCDIDLALGAYWPFVRLALARWQPNAIVAADPPGTPGDTELSLSPVVLADIVQTAPGRTATVSVGVGIPRPITVTVTGASFATTAVDRAAPLVNAHLERQLLRTRSDADWETVTVPAPLTRSALIVSPVTDGRPFQWQGTLQLGGVNTLRYRYRVVIEEFEQYRTDGNVLDQRIVNIPGRGPVLTRELRDGRRLVHLDVVALDGLL